MKALTVEELKKICIMLCSQGYGDKKVLVSDDDECNGYHALWTECDLDICLPRVWFISR